MSDTQEPISVPAPEVRVLVFAQNAFGVMPLFEAGRPVAVGTFVLAPNLQGRLLSWNRAWKRHRGMVR